MNIWTKAFWKATTERVVASIGGAALSVMLASGPFELFHANWEGIASVSLGAGAVSLVKALAASRIGNDGPSLVKSEQLAVKPQVK